MAHCLIALGSNLGDRAAIMRQAVAELSRLPGTELLARSSWHQTAPIGGSGGQGQFLNGAALLATSLTPAALIAELRRVESQLGRVRAERWEARSLDLDLLLYDAAVLQRQGLIIPHPRMAFRRFVLEPAAEVAAWMVHPESGWTVGGLLNQLDCGANLIAIAAAEEKTASTLAAGIGERLRLSVEAYSSLGSVRLGIVTWNVNGRAATVRRPRLLLAVGSGGTDSPQLRKMLSLPPTGPVAWVGGDGARLVEEAVAAVQSVWPELAT
jgi:2-amino-4-hydroxy-6-hydroxymethyldihydropteridine diphosphokinase